MSQAGMRLKAIASVTGVSFIVLWTAGCGPSKEVKTLREQNQALTRQVAELEGQLKQADAAVAVAPAPAPVVEVAPTAVKAAPPVLYIVVEGDSLWNIAKNKLGSGTRYKEILALNSHIAQDKPLAIGTQLKLPPQ